MDPPQVTEFASQRYFEKLRQLTEARDQPQAGQSQDGSVVAQSSTFILPIGRPRSPEHVPQPTVDVVKTAEKKIKNFSFRNILPSRTSIDHDHRRLSTEVTKQRRLVVHAIFNPPCSLH
jgi:hypothetical protein